MLLAAAALGELTGLFPINQLKLTGLKNVWCDRLFGELTDP